MAAAWHDTLPAPLLTWVWSAGTLVFPRNKYLVLKMGQKEVLCEDVLESMVRGRCRIWPGSAG
jgi:hypothetical protein